VRQWPGKGGVGGGVGAMRFVWSLTFAAGILPQCIEISLSIFNCMSPPQFCAALDMSSRRLKRATNGIQLFELSLVNSCCFECGFVTFSISLIDVVSVL
jgi:hypothetical protein